MPNKELEIDDIEVPDAMLDAFMVARGLTPQHTSRKDNVTAKFPEDGHSWPRKMKM